MGKEPSVAFIAQILKRFLCVNLRANNRDIHMGSNNKKMNCVFRILITDIELCNIMHEQSRPVNIIIQTQKVLLVV